jgi:hypothetical protein
MDNNLKKVGDKILYEEGLLDILKNLGKVQIVGSYDLDLLIKPDIDLAVCVQEYDLKKYFSICTDIAEKIKPIRIKYIDQSVAQFDALPFNTGYFLGINLKRDNIKWSIDVWVFTPEIFEERVSYHNKIKEALNQSNRKVLMDIKSSICENPNYRSVDLYQAVLFDRVSSLQGYTEWYKKRYFSDFT